ncbi:glycerophosphodiester phosphodiesterase family protein [Gracilinema caldarium]|uniref:glycerophosphodiester phosphodiesterase n=1 Tax=Gracilinema caldarium TaxID=215591 RepID=UPI0026F23C73|nr:glycerophosphodiester phosphodiesterase family protein [Gracilinema caldarium]
MSRVPLLPEYPRPLLFAHRGCSSLAPENTMESFSLAKSLGAPGLELDIHRCKSGQLVVLHDDSLKRIAGLDRNIEDCTWDEIKDLNVGSWFDKRFSHCRLPMLQEVLESFLPDLYIDIELKTRKTSLDPLPEALADMLASFGRRAEGRITVSSFNPLALRSFKKDAPQFPTAVIWCDDPELPSYLHHGEGRWLAGCDYLKPIHHKVNRAFSLMLGRLGRRPIVPWTVDDPDLARMLLDKSSAGLITNKPQDILPVIKEYSHG